LPVGGRRSATAQRLESPADLNMGASIPPVAIRAAKKRFNSQGLDVRESERRRTMTYNKPEIVMLDSGLCAIQGTTPKMFSTRDNAYPHPDNASTNAYESDE